MTQTEHFFFEFLSKICTATILMQFKKNNLRLSELLMHQPIDAVSQSRANVR